ncbi:hypothetical protein HY345_02355 [Candidatus Microgenomates bacterium]|nr:hypothetical protein [Candidatus Microgenomates bacterium]
MRNERDRSKVESDYDGTLTDTFANAENYRGATVEVLSSITGVSAVELRDLLEAKTTTVRRNPARYGWKQKISERGDEIIVAPATVDAYLLTMAGVELLLKHLQRHDKNFKYPSREQLQTVHPQAYQKAGVVFREDAQLYVVTLCQETDFAIVSNSGTDKVREKLGFLLKGTPISSDDIRLIGDARKYKIDFNQPFFDIPMAINVPGLDRPWFSWRRDYHHALMEVLGKRRGGSKPKYAVGDIGEMDLLLPWLVGFHPIQLVHDHTPKWEKDFFAKKGSTVKTLTQAVDVILSGK